jgi:hypothetical protein
MEELGQRPSARQPGHPLGSQSAAAPGLLRALSGQDEEDAFYPWRFILAVLNGVVGREQLSKPLREKSIFESKQRIEIAGFCGLKT